MMSGIHDAEHIEPGAHLADADDPDQNRGASDEMPAPDDRGVARILSRVSELPREQAACVPGRTERQPANEDRLPSNDAPPNRSELNEFIARPIVGLWIVSRIGQYLSAMMSKMRTPVNVIGEP
jgi:hypothetical protein